MRLQSIYSFWLMRLLPIDTDDAGVFTVVKFSLYSADATLKSPNVRKEVFCHVTYTESHYQMREYLKGVNEILRREIDTSNRRKFIRPNVNKNHFFTFNHFY